MVEVGGGLRKYVLGTRHLVDGYRSYQQCSAARGTLLVPWPGPLSAGEYAFGGSTYRVPLTRPGAAVHGLVQRRPWTVIRTTPDEARLQFLLGEDPGYPFRVRVEATYRLAAQGLAVELVAQNVGDVECPYAAGAHPYLTTGTVRAPDALVEVPRMTPVEMDGSATADAPFAPLQRDVRPLSDLPLGLYTDLGRDATGQASLRLRDPVTGEVTRLWVDESFRYLRLYADRGGSGQLGGGAASLAVEPWTSPGQALRTGRDLVLLRPGQSHRARWGLAPW